MIVIKHKQSNISNILKEYPKSAWNTLDFEPSYIDPETGNLILKSPFAYNDNKSKNNGQNYIA